MPRSVVIEERDASPSGRLVGPRGLPLFQGTSLMKNHSPQHPIVGLCLDPYHGPEGGDVSCGRGTGVPRSQETPTPLGSPKVPWHRTTVRSYGDGVSYERGMPRVLGGSKGGRRFLMREVPL